jgi:DNA helicase-2/ATP-dependent DNA helicase PcrA
MPLSYSQLSAYRSCPRQFEYGFVKKLPQPLSTYQSFGVSVHSALAKWGKREMQNSKCKIQNEQGSLFEENSQVSHFSLSLDELLQLWHESFIINTYPSTVEADFDRTRGERLMQEFFEWWRKEDRTVIGVEKGFSLDLGLRTKDLGDSLSPTSLRRSGIANLPLHKDIQHDDSATRRRESHVLSPILKGRFDRVEELPDGTLRVIDFKTVGPRTQEQVDQDLQLSVYAMAARSAFSKTVSELVMLFLVDTKLIEVISERGEGELKTAAKTISLLSERISTKNYAPTPGKDVCRHCPYKRVCDVAAV